MPLSVIVNDRGTPEPPTEVVRRLRAVDPKLTLRVYAHARQEGARRAADQLPDPGQGGKGG